MSSGQNEEKEQVVTKTAMTDDSMTSRNVAAIMNDDYHLHSAESQKPWRNDTCLLDHDDDDIWGEIMLNLDFQSAQGLYSGLFKKNDDDYDISRSNGNKFGHVWRTMYDRHYFAPVDSNTATINETGNNGGDDFYWRFTEERRRLLSNLLQLEKQKKIDEQRSTTKAVVTADTRPTSTLNLRRRARAKRSAPHLTRCFNLPNRYFHFKPIVPSDLLDEMTELDDEDDSNNDNNVHDDPLSSSPTDVSWINDTHQGQHQLPDGQRRFRMPHRQQPPVVFECDSFVLTSPGLSSELVLLDPFDGRLSILRDITTHCVASDEAMMERAMIQATKAIMADPRAAAVNCSNSTNIHETWSGSTDDDAEIAGAAIDDSVYQNHTQSTRRTPACQELLSDNEYFTFDVTPYFMESSDNTNTNGRNTAGPAVGGRVFQDDEFDLCYVGVDARPIMDFDVNTNPEDDRVRRERQDKHYTLPKITGFMVAVGRTVTSINHDHVVCSELTLWKRKNVIRAPSATGIDSSINGDDDLSYNTKFVCRFRSNLELVDFDPRTDRAFVLTSGGLENAHQDRSRSNSRRRNKASINIFPMIQSDDEHNNTNTDDSDDDNTEISHVASKYFPAPLSSVSCNGQATCFAVDGTGSTLIVGTDLPAIEVWDVQSCHEEPKRIELLHVRKSLGKSIQEFLEMTQVCRGNAASCSDDTNSKTPSNAEGNDEPIDASLFALGRQSDLPHICAPVDSLFLPKHLPAATAGFITLHYSRDEGSSLILWRYIGPPSNKILKPSSIINLRLSLRRKPRVTYDGNRIIVLGEDHIGVIILVYQVSNGDESFPIETDFEAMTCEHSGGVYNLTNPTQVRFRNRIRHAALGGINHLDTLHLTSNERFIIVNTKTGDLLTGASFPFSEGLLVIDLQDRCM